MKFWNYAASSVAIVDSGCLQSLRAALRDAIEIAQGEIVEAEFYGNAAALAAAQSRLRAARQQFRELN